jgi:hypothetical protein
VRHQTCSVESCTIPGAFCYAHHKNPWSRGGRSDLEDATLLRPRHHRAAHLPGYAATHDGSVTRIAKVVRRRQQEPWTSGSCFTPNSRRFTSELAILCGGFRLIG